MIYVNNAGLEFEILEKKGKNCLVRFCESGSVRKANADNIKAGKVKDLYAPSRYGVGFDGDFIKCTYWKRAKDLWSNMLKRCYCESDPKGYYGKVTVDKRWHCFANFLSDLSELEGFDLWLARGNMQLDKDRSGTKVYSRETCMFLSEFDNKSQQTNYRIGKRLCKETRKWITTTS